MNSPWAGLGAQAVDTATGLTEIVRPSETVQAKIMGGPFTITIVNGRTHLADEVADYIRGLERKWSRFIADSELMKLNWAEGKAVRVSSETITLVDKLIEGFRLSDGIFDPTSLPLTLANGYTMSTSSKAVTRLPESATYPGNVDGIEIDRVNSAITLPLGTTLDAGGLGKGLAADLAVAFAMREGAAGALISANGDIVVDGDSTDGNCWRIGIEHPTDETAEVAQVKLTRGAVITSSRVYHTWKDKQQTKHHLIDVKNGRSAQTSALSATIIAGSGARAEALAKLPFMMDIDDSVALIDSLGAAVCVIDEEMYQYTNENWEIYL